MDRTQALTILWGAHAPEVPDRWWRRQRCRCGAVLAHCGAHQAARRVVPDPYNPAQYDGGPPR